MDSENDTGVLVNYLDQTLDESRRLREDLKQGRREGETGEPAGGASPGKDAPAAEMPSGA